MMMSDRESLCRSELLAGLTSEQIEQIAALGREAVYELGDVIVCEGEASDEVYIVCQGMVEVLLTKGPIPCPSGSPHMKSVAELGPGQSFGEMALVDRGARSATVRCLEDGTSLHVIPGSELLALCDRDPRVGYVLMRNVASDLSFKLRHRNLLVKIAGDWE
jgi:CRP-like cAMP-binding protein